MASPEWIERNLESILLQVQKPGPYVGGELNAIVNPWDLVSLRTALVFPDIYDIGVSNVGLKILYDETWPDAVGLAAVVLSTKRIAS